MPQNRPAPTVGAPATIRLYTDTIAAVVTRVSASTVWVRRVETGPAKRVNHKDEPYPVIHEEGVLDKPYGVEERYARNDERGWHGPKSRGSVIVVIGYSISRTDYRN